MQEGLGNDILESNFCGALTVFTQLVERGSVVEEPQKVFRGGAKKATSFVVDETSLLPASEIYKPFTDSALPSCQAFTTRMSSFNGRSFQHCFPRYSVQRHAL